MCVRVAHANAGACCAGLDARRRRGGRGRGADGRGRHGRAPAARDHSPTRPGRGRDRQVSEVSPLPLSRALAAATQSVEVELLLPIKHGMFLGG